MFDAAGGVPDPLRGLGSVLALRLVFPGMATSAATGRAWSRDRRGVVVAVWSYSGRRISGGRV